MKKVNYHLSNSTKQLQNKKKGTCKMELTLKNLIDYIIKYEFYYYRLMSETKILFGEESNDFKFWNAKWSVFLQSCKKV